MKVQMAGVTHRGVGRPRNEDCFGFGGRTGRHDDGSVEAFTAEDGVCLALVADGLGGHPAGGTASRLVVESVLSDFPQGQDALVSSILRSHRVLVDAMDRDRSLRGMASTIVAVLIAGGECTVANVGDSEAFAVTPAGTVTLTVLDAPRDDIGVRGFRSSTLTQFLGVDRRTAMSWCTSIVRRSPPDFGCSCAATG